MFTFRESDHSYWLDARRLDGVTEILRDAGMVNGSWFTEESRTRGTYVHAATEMIDKGSLDWTALDPVLIPYCQAYQKFVEDKRPVILLSEKHLYHAVHLYAGTPDRVVTLDGATALIDLKTGVPAPATAIQVAAYRELVRVNEDIIPAKCFSLHLRDDGTYRLAEINDLRRHFNIFLAALTVVRWRRENL